MMRAHTAGHDVTCYIIMALSLSSLSSITERVYSFTWLIHGVAPWSSCLIVFICLPSQLQRKQCPFDQSPITQDIKDLPANYALLQLVGAEVTVEQQKIPANVISRYMKHYAEAKACIEELALYLKPLGKYCWFIMCIYCYNLDGLWAV